MPSHRPSCSFDTRIEKKEEERCNNYCELKYEIARMWRMKDVEVIPVVHLLTHLSDLGTAEGLQKFSKKGIRKRDCSLILSLSQSLLYQRKCNSLMSVIALVNSLICKISENCNYQFSNVIAVIE